MYLKPTFERYTFEGESFPKFDYPEPDRIRSLVGSYRVVTEFYNSRDEKVAVAAEPGRYFAVATVTSAAGDSFTLHKLLFRLPHVNDLRRADADEKVAALMAHAYGDDAALTAKTAAMENQQRLHDLKKRLGQATHYEYAAVTPPGYGAVKETRWPVIVFLHGGSASGPPPLDQLRTNVAQKVIGQRKDFPFILVIPRSLVRWEPPAVADLLDEVERTYRVDSDRIYLTGYSMGGTGTLDAAMAMPKRFAAIAAGGTWGEPEQMVRLKEIPLWFMQGEKDNLDRAMETIEALKKAGARFRYTIIPGAAHLPGHEGMYATAEMYDWLLQQRRGELTQPHFGTERRAPATPNATPGEPAE
jgi:dipeptidyl aminopeptidase/acylaminoacyl peptidase